MKRKFVTLLLGLLLVPGISQATDFTDTDQMYGVESDDATQFWQTWAAHKLQLDALYEGILTNSAGLRGALSDETGTGVSVFGTNPTFAESIALGVASTTQGYLTMFSNGSAFHVRLLPGANTEDHTFRLPASPSGGTNYLLNVDADGTMDYTDPATFGGGSMTWPSVAGIPYWTSGTAWGGAYQLVQTVDITGVGQTTDIPSEAAVGDALALKANALGADDNYVTDAEKVIIGNTSGSNTGDQSLPTESSLAVDDLKTLSGVAGGATNLGAFTGATIADNQTNKQAMQALETAVEGVAGGHDAVSLNASATTGGMSLSTQEISNRAATNAQTGYATAAHITAIEANTAKTGVTTEEANETMDASPTNGNTGNTASSDGIFDDLALKGNITSQTFVTPNIGAATGTSLVLSSTIETTGITVSPIDDGEVYFDPLTASESEWYIGPDHDAGGDDNDPLEFRQSTTPGSSVMMSIAASTGDMTVAGDVGVGDDVLLADGAVVGITGNEVITFNAAGTIVASGAVFSSTGGVASLTPVTDSTADFAANFTGANLYGGVFIANADDGDLVLPAMLVGMNFTIITLGAIEIVADTNAADGYLMDGTTGVEGANLTNTSTAGDMAVIQYYTADDWLITTNGWTAE